MTAGKQASTYLTGPQNSEGYGLALSESGDILVAGRSDYNNITGAAKTLIARLPADGSLAGAHGAFAYSDAAQSISNPSGLVSAPITLTDAAATLTNTTATLTNAASSLAASAATPTVATTPVD